MKTLNPNWIVGFVDGNGHFIFSNDQSTLNFVIPLDHRSLNVLYLIKSFFKCGSVKKTIHPNQIRKNMREYRVSSHTHLKNIIIPFFQKWPLQTSKKKSFERFVEKINPAVERSSFEFPEQSKLNLEWFIGFLDAKACFNCSIHNRTIQPQFRICLPQKEKSILDRIQHNFNFGVRYQRTNGVEIFQLNSNKNMCYLAKKILLTKGFKDRLKTSKRIRARKWCKIVFLIEQKQHTTMDGWTKIRKLYQSF
uniref:Homing endonuclease LAGLIDADG domain-containing protein n=1 Tax=Pseudocodium devriesii TaxID=453070 RepID=A0A386B109_9CHLO|nr:hypothetical protein [Pseudocodium devriesii]AYC65377.1 hypothetical protein [Pseudocodium devriesii]